MSVVGKIIVLLGMALIVFILFIFGLFLSNSYKEYNTYKTFCEDKPEFCYCSMFACEYKTQWSSVNGLSNDTIELCELANKLNDKETFFKAGCN